MIFDKDTVTLSCVASGYFPLNMTWIGPKGPVESPDCLTTDTTFNTRELICPVQVSKDDDGKYMCTATSYGGNSAASVTLNVNSGKLVGLDLINLHFVVFCRHSLTVNYVHELFLLY